MSGEGGSVSHTGLSMGSVTARVQRIWAAQQSRYQAAPGHAGRLDHMLVLIAVITDDRLEMQCRPLIPGLLMAKKIIQNLQLFVVSQCENTTFFAVLCS